MALPGYRQSTTADWLTATLLLQFREELLAKKVNLDRVVLPIAPLFLIWAWCSGQLWSEVGIAMHAMKPDESNWPYDAGRV